MVFVSWILSNNKAQKRQGKVQLIDTSELNKKLRKNLGDKNCAFTPKHIEEIIKSYQAMSVQDRDEEHKLAFKVFSFSHDTTN